MTTAFVTCAALASLVACSSGAPRSPPTVEATSPAFGPLSGGIVVELAGEGFLSDAAAPDHVLVGGRESPLASVIDDHTLQFVLPPGTAAGDAVIAVFNQNGGGSKAGIFHYSSAPTITAVSPAKVLYSSTATTVTVTGSGFQDEEAGRVAVLLDGTPAVDVQVLSDTQLTFTALPDEPFVARSLRLTNKRGAAERPAALHYVPSISPGLLLFFNDGRTFATFFDPVAGTSVTVASRAGSQQLHMRSVITATDGTLIGLRSDGLLGTIDFRTQELLAPVAVEERLPAAVRIGATVYAVSPTRQSLVTVNPSTGVTTILGALPPACCSGYAVAGDATGTLYYGGANQMGRSAIATVDVTTGAQTPMIQLTPPGLHICELRFLGDTLYGISGNDLLAIDLTTYAATVVHTFNGKLTAMEVMP